MATMTKYLVSYDFKKSFLFFFERVGKGSLELEVDGGNVESVEEIRELENNIKKAFGFSEVIVSNIKQL